MTGFGRHRGRPLSAGGIYDIVRARTFKKFGKAMGLHDFRRAAATYLAMDAPDMVGLIPGMLQHASDKIAERYNLAPSVQASRRHAAHLGRSIHAGHEPATHGRGHLGDRRAVAEAQFQNVVRGLEIQQLKGESVRPRGLSRHDRSDQAPEKPRGAGGLPGDEIRSSQRGRLGREPTRRPRAGPGCTRPPC